MKKTLLSLILIMSVSLTAAFAQQQTDIIILKNSEKIEAKIVEVTTTEVAYKRASYIDGPTFTLSISEISSIVYANGEVQAFGNTVPVTTETAVQSSPRTSPTRTSPARTNAGQGKLRFNPEPSDNRPFGISIGYTSKQQTDGEDKVPWVYLGNNENKKSSAALRVGLYWAPEFRYGLGIQTGLYYEMSYSKEDSEGIKISWSEHNLSIPLRIQYRYEIISDLSVFIYTGPSFDISLANTMKASADGYSEKINVNVIEESGLNRFNMLWGVGAGVRWRGLQLMLGGDWGLTKIYKDDYGIKLNKPFSISLSYQF